MTKITLNGEPREVSAQTIAELLREVGAPTRGIAVALNDSVVRRTELEATPLHAGDRVELIRAVQGG